MGLKLRLAHIKVVPAPAEEGGASSADADRAASRAKDALDEWKVTPPKKQKCDPPADLPADSPVDPSVDPSANPPESE